MYSVKFLNCFRRVARKLEEFRSYIINKKCELYMGVIHLCPFLKMVRWRSIPSYFSIVCDTPAVTSALKALMHAFPPTIDSLIIISLTMKLERSSGTPLSPPLPEPNQAFHGKRRTSLFSRIIGRSIPE